MTIGYGQTIPQLKSQLSSIQGKNQEKGENKAPIFVEFESDHEILKRLMHLKLDGALLPVSDFNFFYKQALVDKLKIYGMPFAYEVGFFSAKSCNHPGKEISNLTLYLNKNSPEEKWLKRSKYKKMKTVHLGYYEQLELLNGKGLSCHSLVLGNLKYQGQIKSPKNVDFLSVGSVPVMLIMYEKFISSNDERIKNVLTRLNAKETDKKQILNHINTYNEFENEVKMEMLNDFIK